MDTRRVRGFKMLSLATLLVAAPAVLTIAANSQGNVPFPKNFRSWTHTKSVVAFDKEDPFYGYRNVYANSIALATLKNGGIYPDGSELVMSFHEPVKNDGTYTQGKPIKYVVMLKDKKKFADTNGWGYEAYGAADMKPLIGAKAAEACHACHASGAADADFVFSKYVE